MPTTLADQLEKARRELLDLTARNRLLNTPLGRGRSSRVDVVGESSGEVVRLLVQKRQEPDFLPAPEPPAPDPGAATDAGAGETTEAAENDSLHLVQPQETEVLSRASQTADQRTDRHLQTALDDETLQGRLLRLFYDARSLFEEQGVNSLYLAVGFLEWYEALNSDTPRYAPLLLIPVELHRRTVNARFRLKCLDDEITTNLSLQARLENDFGLQLPDVPELEELDPATYFQKVEEVIADQPRWKVHRDRMTLWFFSFAKFLMFRDLDPDVWPEGQGPTEHPLVRGLLGEPLACEPPLIGEDEPLDERLDPRTLCHVLDCDSSQAAAVEEVRHGRNLVIQGPPGTGKSQSIVNIIAAAVRDGKTVLFVAEKMAALEVVRDRLARIGLGDICLELHSHKAQRRAVLDDLVNTLDRGRPSGGDPSAKSARLAAVRDQLNEYVRQLHAPLESFGWTPYEAIGRLCHLQARGVQPLDCPLPDMSGWNTTTLREKQALLRDLAEHVAALGAPLLHPWYGVRRVTPLLPTDLTALEQRLQAIQAGLGEIQEHATRLAATFHIAWRPEEESFRSVQRLANLAKQLSSLPEMDRAALANVAWEQSRDPIHRLLERGRELSQCRRELEGLVAPVAWQIDVTQVRVDLATTGHSLFRWFSGRWWAARRTLGGILTAPRPKGLEDQLRILDLLRTGQACLAELEGDGPLVAVGRAAFGRMWHGAQSEWDKLTAIARWEAECRQADVPHTFREVVRCWEDRKGTEAALKGVGRAFRPTWDALQEVIRELEVDLAQTFDNTKLEEVPLGVLLRRISAWREALPELGRWGVFQQRLRDLRAAGLSALQPAIERGEFDQRGVDRLELMFSEAALREAFRQRERIAQFDGIAQSRLVEEFRRLDEERIQLSRREVAAAHFHHLPAGGEHGEVGLIRHEARKKRRHWPLRRLLAEAGHAVQAIKPVFLMSPISVAQFLKPGELHFDLLVIDEASQVRPVEAFGALLRCRQAVIVGDHRQLPPTSFFDRLAGGADEAEEDETTLAGDVESILDLCVSRNFPQRMLRWHYRSRHHSLIAVSNREFYDDKLFVVPTPDREGSARGLEFRFVSAGVFDRGRSRTNRREAQVVAQAMIDHARRHPQQSLGVGTFSISQRDLILDELERLRRDHPETEEFFSRTDREPWFVKNLENIQGDERDVILISVGYGRDESGFLAMNFGPLTAKGGERRLNVLISRARERCVVFSSIRGEDVDLRRTQSRGVAALKTFLQYAETGRLEVSRPTGREHDSVFEAQVADALRSHGWEVDPQVGIAGFFIDLAVVDPAAPGRYLLGIECDGATYHSARWARDRDRLRQAVLQHHGWRLYRLWSTDWFRSPQQELRKLLAKLEEHRLQGRRDGSTPGPSPPPVPAAPAEASEDEEDPDPDEPAIPRDDGRSTITPGRSVPYVEALFRDPLMSRDLETLSAKDLARIVVRIVQVEGPVHREEIVRRMAALWGRQRASRRLAQVIDHALRHALRQGWVAASGRFFFQAGQTDFPIRNRENVGSRTLRRPELLPPQELDAAVLAFVRDHVSATVEETARGVARWLGFRSTSRPLKQRIEAQIRSLVAAGRLVQNGERLRSPRPSPGP